MVFDGSLKDIDQHTADLIDDSSIVVVNKSDLTESNKKAFHVKQGVEPVFISVKEETSIEALLSVLTAQIADKFKVSRETPSLTRQRHRQNLEECQQFLARALEQAQPELMAQDLRFAVNALGRITGRVDVEDLLDVIFKDFCIGK